MTGLYQDELSSCFEWMELSSPARLLSTNTSLRVEALGSRNTGQKSVWSEVGTATVLAVYVVDTGCFICLSLKGWVGSVDCLDVLSCYIEEFQLQLILYFSSSQHLMIWPESVYKVDVVVGSSVVVATARQF